MDTRETKGQLTSGQPKQQQLASHRPQTAPDSKAWRLVKIKVFYSNFFQSAMGEIEMMQCLEVEDLLTVFSNREIEAGFKAYQTSGPRNAAGYLRKPAGGDLHKFLMDIRGRAHKRAEKPKMEDPPADDLSEAEWAAKRRRADEIVGNAGFKLKVSK